MVEGLWLVASGDDCGNSVFKVFKNEAGGNPQHNKTTQCQPGVAPLVTRWTVAAIMGGAVDLYSQSLSEAGKVENVVTQRMLAAELVATWPLAQFPPDEHFRQVASAALPPGDSNGLGAGRQHPSTARLCRAVPLPVPGRSWRGYADVNHIRNTPNCGLSGIGASRHAASASPRTSRVCAGSITPSSHSRAVA